MWRLANRIQGKLTSALVSVVSSDVIRLHEIDRKIRSLFISVDTSLVSKGGLERSQITELNRLKWTFWESEDTRIDPTRPAYNIDFVFFFHHFSRHKKKRFHRSILLEVSKKYYISNLTFLHLYSLECLFIFYSSIIVKLHSSIKIDSIKNTLSQSISFIAKFFSICNLFS